MRNEKPNVLLIMADSLSPHFMGAYGDTAGATPNLDDLARSGVTFERAYCNSPMCAPSRASMMTGRYVSEIGAYDNGSMFPSDIPTFNHCFKRAGYDTILIGKMHFVGYDQYHGFDARLAMETDYSQGYDPRRPTFDWNKPSGANPAGRDWMAPSYVKDAKWDNYRHHYDRDVTIHSEAVRYLSGKTADDGPFFCCVSYHHPHNPFYIPDDIRERFRGMELDLPSVPGDMRERYGVMDKWLNNYHCQTELMDCIMDRDNLRWLYETYYGMTYDMDLRAGELLEIMRSRGLDKNTVIIFTSDHGDMLAHRGMVQKRCFYERSIRAPLIFSSPGTYPSGARAASPVSLLDLFPTIADIAGEAPPEGLLGESLIPAILGEGDRYANRIIYAEYHNEGVYAPCFMAVSERYKYIYVHGHEELLFDLENDPEELENIAGGHKYSGVRDELKRELLSRFDPEAIACQVRENQKNRNYITGGYR